MILQPILYGKASLLVDVFPSHGSVFAAPATSISLCSTVFHPSLSSSHSSLALSADSFLLLFSNPKLSPFPFSSPAQQPLHFQSVKHFSPGFLMHINKPCVHFLNISTFYPQFPSSPAAPGCRTSTTGTITLGRQKCCQNQTGTAGLE